MLGTSFGRSAALFLKILKRGRDVLNLKDIHY
jgi:hypothetical protein